MTEQFGIKLSVSVADLLASVNSAVDSVNNSPKLHKLKLGIDTSAVDAAVKKMRADLSSISLKVGAPKINLGVSTSDVKSQLGGAALISEQSMNAQSGMLDKLTADYTKYFNIVSRRADETAQEIRTKFKGALSDTLGAMSSGDKGQIQSAFDNLTKMTQDYSKTIKNTRGEDIFQDFKNSYLKSWVPVSKSIKSDLEYIYGKGKSLANVLTGAFGVGNWKYVDPGNIHSTDKWLRQFDGTGFSNWANGNTVDGFAQCIDHINTIKELAKEKVTLFSDGTFNTKSIVDYITEFYNLNNAQNSVAESAKKLQQTETETVNVVNQSAAAVKNLVASEENAAQQQTSALQSYETVLQKFEALQSGGFNKYIPSNAKDMMIDVTASEKSAAAVDALGRSFDRIANLPIEEKTRAFKEIMAALSAYASADKLVPENLIKNLNDVCVGITDVEKAQKNETAAAEKAKQAVMGQSEEIKKQNKLLRIRKGISVLTGDVVKHETYGTANKNVTFKYRNGSLESAFSVQNIAAQTEMFNKANAAVEEYLLKVNELVRKNTDANRQKAIKDPVHLEELNKQFEKVKQSITALRGASKETFTSLKSDVETQKTLLSQMADAFKDAEYPGTTLAPKSVETWKQVYSARLDEFVAKNNGTGGLVAAKSELEELRTLLNNITDSASFSKFNDKFDILKVKVKAVNAEMKTAADTAAHIDSGIKSLDRITGDNALAKNSAANMPKYNEIIDKAVSIRNQYQQLLSSLKNDGSAENLAKVKEQVVALDKEMKEAVNTATAFKRELGADRNGEILAKKAAQTHALITDIMNKNAIGMNKINTLSGSGLTFGEEFQRLNAQLTETPELVDSINAKVRTLEAQMKQLGYTGNTLLGDLKEKAVKFIKWTGMTLLITKVRMYFRKLFTTVYELDTALIDLKKTFNGTNDELNDFYFEANRLAKQMGVTTKEIIEQGSAFSRLGYSSNETMKQMAKMSSMFAAISPDMNTEQATDGLVSIMKAFDIDPKNVLDGILSKVNIIGNTAATSNGEIVEMLEKSSSAIKEANNTLEETIALETAAVEITRDASSVGNAYKTISMRIRGYDEETEAFTNDVEVLSGKIANLTKTASKPGGISLFTNENKTTYKSTYQLFKEISEIYDDLTDKQQAGLLEALAGKRQGQIVAATLKNFDAAEEALQNMTNSAGSAEAEMETIRESAAYALNELKETFTSLAQHSVSRGGLKDLIKFGTWALEIVDKIVGKLGLIPAILTTAVGIIASKKATKGGLFGYNSITGKLMVGGVDFKKGWLGNLKAQKAEIVANKQALIDFETEMNKGVVSQQAWNRVMNNSNATVRKFGEGIMNGTVTAQGYAEAVGQVGVKAKLAAVGVRALNTVVSMVTSLLISAALGAVIKAIDNSVHAIENNVDKISELTDKEKSLKSEIENINEQLSDTKLKINELERQDKLTLLEQGELENLKAANDELERQLRLKRGELANTSNEKNKEAQRLWTGMTTHASDRDLTKWYNWWAVIPGAREIGNIVRAVNGEQTDWTDYVPLIGQAVEALGNVSKISRGETWEQQILELEIYKKGLKELEEMKKSSDYMNGDDDAEKRVEETEKSLKSLRDTIQKYYNGNWTALSTGLDPALEENKEILEKVNAVMKEWDNLNKKTYSNFAEIYNDPKFAVTKKQLEELARAGKLNVEIFNELSETDVTGINNFRNELENIENLTVDEVIESIVEETEQLDKAAKKSGMSVDEYTEYLEKLHNALDAVVDKQEKLADAFTKTRLGTALSPQEAYELIKEMPNIKKYLEKMGDGYTISTEGFNAVSNENLENEKQKLADSISLAKEQIELFKELQKTSLELNNSNGQDTELIERFTKLSEATKEMREKLGVKSMGELEDGIAKLQEQLSGDELYLDVITEAFDSYAIIGAYEDMKSAVSDYNDEIEKLDSAIKTLNEGGVLSYDEMVSLVEIAPELNGLFDQLGDGYTVSTETLEEWRQKSYDARNEYIDGLLKQVEATKSAAIDERDAYERVLQVQEKFGDEAQKLAAQVDLDAANERIKKIDEITAVLLAMKKEILSGNEEDNTNALQDEIDYYKTIISAVEIVKNKYAEALDKEIDVLQDSKDALKDANDERQREIDLREALINLENAKKRKVWVFSDDGGFRQEQDKGAVKEAEEKYRDAITDIQEAEIDKQIELREKQKEQLEESVKDLTELESKINDAKTVAQAMAALGLTDEKDLLTLSDDVKESIKEGLADAVTQKEAEENKENNWYKKVTLDDVLKAFGAKVTADEVKNMDLPTLKSYNAAQTLANDIKKWTEETVASTVNNNTNSNVFSPTVNVQGIVTEEKIADVVVDKLKDVFMEYGNSIK